MKSLKWTCVGAPIAIQAWFGQLELGVVLFEQLIDGPCADSVPAMKISFRPTALLSWFLSCALLGAAFFSIFAPKSIAWYFEPPVETGINCRPAAEWAMNKLLLGQVVGVVAGMLLGGILIYVLMKKENQKKL